MSNIKLNIHQKIKDLLEKSKNSSRKRTIEFYFKNKKLKEIPESIG